MYALTTREGTATGAPLAAIRHAIAKEAVEEVAEVAEVEVTTEAEADMEVAADMVAIVEVGADMVAIAEVAADMEAIVIATSGNVIQQVYQVELLVHANKCRHTRGWYATRK